MHTSRRAFLKTAGSLTIGFCLGGQAWKYPTSPQPPAGVLETNGINAWLEILANGRIRVLTGKLELGQGISTAVAQVAAEELDMDMSMVEVALAETDRTPNEGYTAGSGSIERSAMSIRNAAAAARQRLLELAAQKMHVPPDELTLAQGKISLKNGLRSMTFADILDGRQLTDEIPAKLILKPRDSHRLVGKAIPREDIDRMVRGEPVFVHDLRFPGMVHARVVRPPAYGAKLLQYDEQLVKDKVLKTVADGSFLAVIAADEYQAIQAQRLLKENAKWSAATPLPKFSGQQLTDHLQTLPVQTEQVTAKGDPSPLTASPGSGTKTLKASYAKPYIMHGAIGPSCAIAIYELGTLHIWTHSQGVYPLRDSLADLLHLPPAAIHVKGVPGSGCYGHNGADDAAADAALLAIAYPGKHIRVQWMREDEHAWEPYGSAMIMELEALLDSSGKISHWKHALWSDTHGARPGGHANNLLPARYLEKPFTGRPSGFSGGAYRNAAPYYSIPNQQVEAHFFEGPLRASSLRSLGAYANLFAVESFMDELAEKAGKDPFTFRLLHLEDPRAREVVLRLQTNTAAQLPAGIPADTSSGTAKTPPTDKNRTGMGMAFSRYENSKSYCAVAALVSVNTKTGAVQIQKMWAVIDAGEVINLDGIKNQTEGSMIQSASWTLQEQVTFDEQHITSRNWTDYPIFRFNQAPEVEVTVLDHPTEPPLGAGEAAQGPAAAAIVNAIYKACGKRVRHLPVTAAMIISA